MTTAIATPSAFSTFAEGRAPFRGLKPEHFRLLAENATLRNVTAGTIICKIGDPIEGLHVVMGGNLHLISAEGDVLADMHAGDVYGHRALLRDGKAILRVEARTDAQLAVIDAGAFNQVMAEDRQFAAFFRRSKDAPDRAKAVPAPSNLAAISIADAMTASPVTLPPDATARQAAEIMRDKHISCILVIHSEGQLAGIVTARDLVAQIVAGDVAPDAPLSAIMTADPTTLDPNARLLDAVMLMTERHFGHMPVTDKNGFPVGIITQTDLVRRNSNSLIYMVSGINRAKTVDDLAALAQRSPMMLVELVGSGVEAHQVGRMMTSVTDAITRRLVILAEEALGPAPTDWLWLACGSQGRMEQTSFSDQDNCLFLPDTYDEKAHGAWFEGFAKFLSDGLDACGYYYCPGDMMATNSKWRQPVRIWRSYFDGWIRKPEPMAQMLASVMFDLRPIAGNASLFTDMNRLTLEKAGADSIFRAHMIANSLTHTPPLGLFGGLSYVRDGAHAKAVDLKLSGVVPITDLARAYALAGKIEAVNTRDRLIEARQMEGVLSKSGGNDLIDAYDLIAELRLKHQAAQIRAGQKPDNFMVPDTLSALERNHLKDAFSVVKTMQSAIGKLSARR